MSLNTILSLLAGKQYILLAALLVGAVVASAKQGWLSGWLAKKLPPAALPYLALLLGDLGVTVSEIIQGKPFTQALIDGLNKGLVAGLSAVFGHEALVEGLRGGKEIIPENKKSFSDDPPPPPPAAVKAAA